MSNESQLKIGLVGTGYWADHTHASGIAENADVDFVGVWGRDPEATASFAARHATTAFSSSEALFAAVDVVTFAVPPAVQAELAPLAADAGCHLLLEKPIASTPEAADRIVDACDRNGVFSIVNFSNLLGGWTGEWMREVVLPGSWDGGNVTILADLRVADTPFSASPWRRLDNGALWDVGPHALSMLVPALGPVVEVRGEHGVGDTVVLALRHEGGAVSSIILSYSVGLGGGKFDVGFWGANGAAPLPTPPTTEAPASDPIAPALAALVASIRSGKPSAYDARFGAEIVRVLAEADRATQLAQGEVK